MQLLNDQVDVYVDDFYLIAQMRGYQQQQKVMHTTLMVINEVMRPLSLTDPGANWKEPALMKKMLKG